jgi:hypothetical protein
MKTVIAVTIMLAHSWCPVACCHDQDCHPVPCDSIKADGLGLTWEGVVFADDMIRDSMDENCHVCVHSVGRHLRTAQQCALTAVVLLDHRDDDVLLAGKMAVDRAGAQAGLFHDVLS